MTSTHGRGAGFDDEAVEALLAGHVRHADDSLAAVLAILRATADLPAPDPSPELAQLMAAGLSLDELSRRRRRRRTIVTTAVFIGASSLTLSGVAAAHDALPGPIQRVMSGIINTVTPFQVGAPHHDASVPGQPAPRTDLDPPASGVTTAGQPGGSSGGSPRDGDDARPRTGSVDSGPGPRGGGGSDDGPGSGGTPGSAPGSGDGGTDSGGGSSGGGSSGGGSDGGGSGDSGSSPSPSPSGSSGSDGGGSDGGGGTSDGGGSNDGASNLGANQNDG